MTFQGLLIGKAKIDISNKIFNKNIFWLLVNNQVFIDINNKTSKIAID